VAHQKPDFWSLAVINDRRYPGISAEILRAMAVTVPGVDTASLGLLEG
jgi:hypothetical protein